MPVLFRGDQLSRALRLDKLLRLKVFPLAVSLPWGIAPAMLPQLPLPAKIRTRLMPAVEVDRLREPSVWSGRPSVILPR